MRNSKNFQIDKYVECYLGKFAFEHFCLDGLKKLFSHARFDSETFNASEDYIVIAKGPDYLDIWTAF